MQTNVHAMSKPLRMH